MLYNKEFTGLEATDKDKKHCCTYYIGVLSRCQTKKLKEKVCMDVVAWLTLTVKFS